MGKKEESSFELDPTQGTSYTRSIDLPLPAQDTITVSITIDSTPSPTGKTEVKYKFTKRPLVISLIFEEDNFAASSDGSDPTTVITADISVGGPKITIRGTRQIPSLSQTTEEPTVVFLDAPYEQIIPGSWIILERPNTPDSTRLIISQVIGISDRSRADYGITGKSTRVQLDKNKPWLDLENDDFSVIRGTSVFAQSELLELAEEPIDPIEKAICGERSNWKACMMAWSRPLAVRVR